MHVTHILWVVVATQQRLVSFEPRVFADVKLQNDSSDQEISKDSQESEDKNTKLSTHPKFRFFW